MQKVVTLAALATIPSGNSLNSTAFHTFKKLKKGSQSRRYESNNYLSKVYKNFNVDPHSKRAVQTLKKALKTHPDIKGMKHPYHFGMPLENKQAYTAKREETLRRLSTAKMIRASQKLKTNLKPSKRSRLQNRMNRHFGSKR
jgi:hypothetical protein